jgi:hypothetical protein
MTGPFALYNPESPQVKAIMERNPNGVFAMMIKNAWARTGTAPTNNAAGSNNAGGLASNPTAIPSQTRASFGRYTGNSDGLMGPMINAVGSYSRGRNSQFSFSGGDQGSNNNNGMFSSGSIASFAEGGMVTPQGGAIRPNAGMQPEPQLGADNGASLTPQMIDQEANNFVQQHPEEAQKVQALIAAATQSGELTSQELNTAIQLAKTALANPSSYPQIRQYAIQNGLGTEQDLPEQMDKGLLYVLIVAGKSAQSVGPQGNAMQGQGPSPTMENGLTPSYPDGGHTGEKGHIAKLHEHEYVIPKDALIYHGKKHFDKLVEQARTPPDAKSN